LQEIATILFKDYQGKIKQEYYLKDINAGESKELMQGILMQDSAIILFEGFRCRRKQVPCSRNVNAGESKELLH
jgi:hypothetical protein